MPTETKTEIKEEKKTTYTWPFTMGADPEFTVVSGTRPMNAEDIFQTFFKGMKKGDHGFQMEGGNIGWDNHPATGELRPDPGTPEQVVANLKSLFKEAHTRMPFVDLTTLTIAAAAGGHIHLSVPEELNQALENKTPKWAAIERTVGMFIILIMMGENNLSRELRKRVNGGNYGDLLDFRLDAKFHHPNGANGYTLEVRGPTAEWITSEKIALGTLAYMAIAWDSILKGDLKALTPILFGNKTQAREMAGPLADNYGNIQKLYLDRMRPFIRSHPAYPQYKNALELILNPARVLEEKKKMHYCINEGWGFTSTSKSIPTNKFMDEDAIENATSKFPEQILRNLSQFAWNEDLHVEQFATALSKRCVALGWKPKHEYFLFGMKKGMDSLIMRDEEGNYLSGGEIIKNKEDYKVVDNKFNRLGKKAEPIYGRVIHPKTGELTKEKDAKRVMIGIPYAMRQKNDIKPLMRLVLKFEKNPKAYTAIDQSTLPEGKSSLKETMEKDEELEKGFSEAARRGEQPQQLPREMIEAIQEQERENQPERTDTISMMSQELIAQKFMELLSLWRSRWSLTVDGARDALTNIIGRANNWPGIRDNATRETIREELVSAMIEAETRELENDDGQEQEIMNILDAFNAAKSYLLGAAIGTQGNTSTERRATGVIHHIRYRQDGNSPVRQGYYEIQTEGMTSRSGRSRNLAPILDMLGVSSNSARGQIQTLLTETAGGWFAVIAANGSLAPAANATIENGRIIINPDARLPHVWNV